MEDFEADELMKFFHTMSKQMAGLLGAQLRNDSRYAALRAVVGQLAEKQGLDGAAFVESVEKLAEEEFQKRLEAIEKSDPALAAQLDFRKTDMDYPDRN